MGKGFFWVGGSSGSFTDSSNWQDTDGNPGVPGADDLADFGSFSGTVTGSDTVNTINIDGNIVFSGGDIATQGLFLLDPGTSVTIAAGGRLSAVHNIAGTPGLSIIATGRGSQLSLTGFQSANFKVLSGAEATVADLTATHVTVRNGTLTVTDGLGGTFLNMSNNSDVDVTGEGGAGFDTGVLDGGSILETPSAAFDKSLTLGGGSTATIENDLIAETLTMSGGAHVSADTVELQTGLNDKIATSNIIGATLDVAGELTVSTFKATVLDIGAGGDVTANALVLGQIAFGTTPVRGTVTVNGASAQLTIADTSEIGVAGIGVLNIGTGADVHAGDVTIAGEGAPTGGKVNPNTGLHSTNVSSVNVGGATLETGDLTVGEDGYGMLALQEGTVTTGGDGTLAEAAGSEAHVIIQHGEWDVGGSLTAGGAGKALLQLEKAARLSVSGDLSLAEQKGSAATLSGVSGAHLTVAGILEIGGDGKASLTAARLALAVHGDSITLGGEKGSTGSLNMHGGSLRFAHEIVVGEKGKADLLLDQGFTNSSTTESLVLGEGGSGSGHAALDGATTIVALKDISDGEFGQGGLTIRNGATLNADSADIAGRASTHASTLTVSTGATLAVSNDVAVGEEGMGRMNVSGGAQVSVAGELVLGAGGGAAGTLNVSGSAGSVATGLHYSVLTIGESGNGALNVSGGAVVAAIAGGEDAVEIAADNASSGTLNLSGSGTQLHGNALSVGGTETAVGGNGAFTVSSSAHAVFSDVTVWDTGTVRLDGGILTVEHEISGDGKISIGTDGHLILNGHDEATGIVFAKGSSGGELELGSKSEIDALISGFATGDEIHVDGLDTSATFAVTHDGSDTIVTFDDGGTDVMSIELAGRFTHAELHLNTHGILTVAQSAAATELWQLHHSPMPEALL